MARAMHAESPVYSRYAFDGWKVARLIDRLVQARPPGYSLTGGDDEVIGLVAEEEGALIGMAALVAVEQYFSRDKYVTDLCVYVTPEKRGGRAGLYLVHMLEAWAKQANALDIRLGVSTGIETEMVVGMYQRIGYKLDGYVLRKPLKEDNNV